VLDVVTPAQISRFRRLCHVGSICTFIQSTTQRYGAGEQDSQRAEREEREAQRAAEVDFESCESVSMVHGYRVIAPVLRTRCLADFGREKGDNHRRRRNEGRGLGGCVIFSSGQARNQVVNIPSQAAVP
jgi:hypothetical protein